MYYNPHSRK